MIDIQTVQGGSMKLREKQDKRRYARRKSFDLLSAYIARHSSSAPIGRDLGNHGYDIMRNASQLRPRKEKNLESEEPIFKD